MYNRQMETLPKGELRALQGERLRQVLKRVYENVPAYRAKMEAARVTPQDIKGADDIYKLPFTVKQDLRDGYPFGMFAAPRSEIVRLHASSGTTGKLTVVGYTRHDIEVWSELMARALAAVGATRDSMIHIAYGYGLFTGGLGAHYGAEKLGATAVPVSSGNTKRQIMLLKDFEADILCCTPSYALYIAEEIRKESLSISDFKLKAGVFGAEPWSEAMRAEIEEKLGISAYDIYGLSEIMGPGVSIECEHKAGGHIWEDHFIAEVIDPDTLEPLDYGKEGELVITTITKEGIPMIRYRTRDITTLLEEPCKCGRTHVRMKRVLGRTDDMLIIRGVNIFPSQIENVIAGISGVEPFYQLVVDRVEGADILEVQVEVSQALFSDQVKKIEAVKQLLEREIYSALGLSVKVTLCDPDSLPRSEGKSKRVIDKRKF
ncbi:MAG: phenylacetate--CoA ligase [Clostridiales bacterium]|jgi:phenylacetate-CoA ligase|nr:phenylacetate--CoA ligase [Clostridiales bacterium]